MLITLDSGETVEVRRLGLYELDSIPFDDPGDFVFTYLLANNEMRPVSYTLADFPPGGPEKPELPKEAYPPDSVECALWDRRLLYEAVATHTAQRVRSIEAYAHDVARYVLDTCIENPSTLKSLADLEQVLSVAITQEVGLEHVADVLKSTFQSVLEWARYIVSLTDLASREGESQLAPAVGRADPASLGA